tara:strand:+ start:1353 stop:2042 length:690 start_codon:yes stop_codon:yes gene_type:complete
MNFLTNPYLILFAQVVFIIGYVVAFFIDHFPWSLRVVGKKLNKFPLSTLRSTQILMVNRFGAAFCFTSAGFLVDAGTTINEFYLYFAITWGLLGTASFVYITNWKIVFKFLANNMLRVTIVNPDVKNLKFSLKYTLLNYPFIFNTLGASIPILSASFFPEYRGLLLQLGFVFNSISSILLVFVLEPIFMNHIGNDELEEADFYHQKFIISKTILLFMFSGLGFFCYLLT